MKLALVSSHLLRLFLHLVIAMACLCAAVQADPPTKFVVKGIGGGGAMYSPTINPGNPLEMAVACDMSPQFVTADGGKTWGTIDFRQMQSGHECSIRYTRDPAIRWAIDFSTREGNDGKRVVRSNDGGKTWKPMSHEAWPEDRTAWMIYADYEHPERALVAAEYRQLWITLDGGKTFQQKLTVPGESGLHLAGVFFDDDTIYAGTGGGLYISSDGGKTFARSTAEGLPPGNFLTSFAGGKNNGKTKLYCVTHKQGWAGIQGEEHGGFTGVWVLEVGQKTWVKQTNGLPNGSEPFFVRMAGNDCDTAYVAGGWRSAPCVFKTTDGGTTWADVFLTDGNRNIVTAWSGDGGDRGWSYGEYALGFEVSTLDKNNLLLTDLGCAHASDDGGKTWRAVYTTPLTARAVGTCPKGQAYLGNGMEMTSIWQMLWFDAANLFVCATDIKGYRSTDGGKSWSFNYVGHDLNTMYRAVTHPATKVTYAAVSSVHDMYQSTYLADARIDSGSGAVLASSDMGANWKTVGKLAKPVVWVELDPRNPNRLYAAMISSKEGGIYVTDDLDKGVGCSWTRLAAPPRTEGHPYNIRVLTDGALVCTFSGRRAPQQFTASSGVFLSADGGKTWEDRTDPAMRYWTKDMIIDPADQAQNTWYAGVFFAWGNAGRTGKNGLYRTRDRGKTWTLLTDSTLAPSGVLNVESGAFDPAKTGQFYFTTEYDGLFYSPDIRAEKPAFQPVESYRFKHPLRIQFNPQRQSEIWVTSFGNGMAVGQTN